MVRTWYENCTENQVPGTDMVHKLCGSQVPGTHMVRKLYTNQVLVTEMARKQSSGTEMVRKSSLVRTLYKRCTKIVRQSSSWYETGTEIHDGNKRQGFH